MEIAARKISRNELCPCDSGFKYKKCCLNLKEFAQSNNLFDGAQFEGMEGPLKVMHPQGNELKMSEVIIEFAGEFLDLPNKKSSYRNMIMLVCMAWNIGCLPEPAREDAFDLLCTKRLDSEERELMHDLIFSLVEKKDRDYSHIRRIVINHEVYYRKGESRLIIASADIPDTLSLKSDLSF